MKKIYHIKMNFASISITFGLLLMLFFTNRIAFNPISDNDKSRLAGIISVARHNELKIDHVVQVSVGDRIESFFRVHSPRLAARGVNYVE